MDSIILDTNWRMEHYKPGRSCDKTTRPRFGWMIIGFLMVALLGPIGRGGAGAAADEQLPKFDPEDVGTDYRYGFEGFGTTHEQMGQGHWPTCDYTEYVSKVEINKPPPFSNTSLQPIFNFTHLLFDNTLLNDPHLPDGYVVAKSKETVVLGPRVDTDDWRDLLWVYWLYLLWAIFLIFLIIILPFIAVCYCCFCCCRRCAKGCPPCTAARECRLRWIFGIILFLLIVLILLGTLVAIFSSRLLDQGISEGDSSLRRSSENTCSFLKDVSDHIYHLFVYNYEELLTHLVELLTNAHNHLFMDISDTSEADAIEELERILTNMPKARKLLAEVNTMEKELRFATSQLRDGIRGVKRETGIQCSISGHMRCQKFMRYSSIQMIDTTKCIHLDELPDTAKYVIGAREIIEDKASTIAKNALMRLQKVKNLITLEMDKVAPPFIYQLNKGREKLLYQADKIRNIIEAIISDIHFIALRSSKSFEDLYDHFSSDRAKVHLAINVILVLLLLVLIFALICGCVGSKALGAMSLFVAIIIVFCVFSLIILVGLFYFFIGLITYEGACSPLEHRRTTDIVRQLSRFMPPDLTADTTQIRMSTALHKCAGKETIFQVMRDNDIYDVTSLTGLSIVNNDMIKIPEFHEDFSKMNLLTATEKESLLEIRDGNLSSYHSVLYIENMCKTLTPQSLPSVAKEMREISDAMYTYWGGYWVARISFSNNALNLETYHKEWVVKIHSLQDKIKQKLRRVDDLILYNNNNFGDSINVLIKAIIRSEAFMQSRSNKFINHLISNLTSNCSEQVDLYIDMLISKCSTEVGRCDKFECTYYQGLKVICNHLIDPINGCWVGLLFTGLLLLPLLWVAHRLMCLYKVYVPYRRPRGAAARALGSTCPTCTGSAYVAPPVIVCTGGQQQRALGGGESDTFISLPDQTTDESKRKRD